MKSGPPGQNRKVQKGVLQAEPGNAPVFLDSRGKSGYNTIENDGILPLVVLYPVLTGGFCKQKRENRKDAQNAGEEKYFNL